MTKSHRFDALLLVSFGGPEGPGDVMPFLENVTRGRAVPPQRLQKVGQHYFQFDGISPINEQNRQLVDALRSELDACGIDLPVYWGNRNWTPYLVDTLRLMRDDGVQRSLAFFTSAYSSYSGCRQYRENLAAARREVGDGAPTVERMGPYFNHPGFVDPFVDNVLAALGSLPASQRLTSRLVFTTHSIPLSMATSSGVTGDAYVTQHEEVARLVADQVNERSGASYLWDLVFQSRSGPPEVPWLEPDVEDHFRGLKSDGVNTVVVVPIGFVSDHMEVVWDLDTQAQATAKRLGLSMVRARTPGVDPRFVSMIVQLAQERLGRLPPEQRQRVGTLGAAPDRCGLGCCPNPRAPLPAVGGDDTRTS